MSPVKRLICENVKITAAAVIQPFLNVMNNNKCKSENNLFNREIERKKSSNNIDDEGVDDDNNT